MSATRFYFSSTAYATNSPGFDGGWEQTGEASRFKLIPKLFLSATTAASSRQVTVPITTTQDILAFQSVSDPLPAQIIEGTVSLVIRTSEDVATTNCTMAVVIKVVSQDGGTQRGTLFSVFGTDTEFDVAASPSTRIVNAQTMTALSIQGGDRLVVEWGVHATVPSPAGTALGRIISDATIADYALTSALTTSLNPWVEFSDGILLSQTLNNYTGFSAGDGMSLTEHIR